MKATSPRISPRARRALKRRGLDARDIAGSGPRGRIVEADVLRFDTPIPSTASSESTASPESTAPPEIIHLRAELDASSWLQMQEKYRDYARKRDATLAPVDFLLKAWASALCDVAGAPSGEIGLVSDWPTRETTIVLQDAAMGLLALSRRRGELIEEARSKPVETRATSMLFDAGAFGDDSLDEITPPLRKGCIVALGAGRVAPRPFVATGVLGARPTLRLCLAFDAKMLDSATAAALLARVVEILREPALLAFL